MLQEKPNAPIEVTRGDSHVVLGMPHGGTRVPDGIAARLNPLGSQLADTDWYIHRLYEGLLPGATIVRATFHRYVIDANRDPLGLSLYPGQNTTGLVPLTDFDGESIWTEPPADDEVEQRRKLYHGPYHAALAAELERVRNHYGIVIFYDCHSIRSTIPFLFEGTLPDFNIGSNDGTSCAPQIEAAVANICAHAKGYTCVSNGRFKGGWSTRHYGQPEKGVHAIQMELAQSAYLQTEAPPFAYDENKAEKIRWHLRHVLESLEDWALKQEKPYARLKI